MTMVVNQNGAAQVLGAWIAAKSPMKLRLYSNNRTPVVGDVLADYTQVSGGGYSEINLSAANWTVTAGSPSVALYSALQEFSFSTFISPPGTIYGYYIVDSDNVLILAERFPEGSVPFAPVDGSIIRIRPRISNQNLS